eukprot:15446829-Alexandrium_andersonii.AAC.1
MRCTRDFTKCYACPCPRGRDGALRSTAKDEQKSAKVQYARARGAESCALRRFKRDEPMTSPQPGGRGALLLARLLAPVGRVVVVLLIL